MTANGSGLATAVTAVEARNDQLAGLITSRSNAATQAEPDLWLAGLRAHPRSFDS